MEWIFFVLKLPGFPDIKAYQWTIRLSEQQGRQNIRSRLLSRLRLSRIAVDKVDTAEDGEPDRTLPLGGPQHVLQEVQRQEVQRADEPRPDANDEHETHDAWLDAEHVWVERVSPPGSSPLHK